MPYFQCVQEGDNYYKTCGANCIPYYAPCEVEMCSNSSNSTTIICTNTSINHNETLTTYSTWSNTSSSSFTMTTTTSIWSTTTTTTTTRFLLIKQFLIKLVWLTYTDRIYCTVHTSIWKIQVVYSRVNMLNSNQPAIPLHHYSDNSSTLVELIIQPSII